MSFSSRAVALAALRRWRTHDAFADAIVHDLLRESRLSDSDRAFALELFYGALRNLRLLDFWIGQLRDAPVDDDARDVLRLGLYQIFLLGTPPHAAVHATVDLARTRARPLINGVLRSALRQKAGLSAEADKLPLAVCLSHPDFLIEKWINQFGAEATEKLCRWDNQPAPVYVRSNELRVSPTEFRAMNPEAVPIAGVEAFFELRGSPLVPVNRGECYAQDPSTASACELLDPKPGETVLDACAAPGGKAGYIAQRMRNDGLLIACDRDARRLPVLQENLDRLGVRIARVQQCDWLAGPAAVQQALQQIGAPAQFDRILLDAPCSNTGVMRRRVDVRWRLTETDFRRMHEQQVKLGCALVPFLKEGGTFVYSTCSLEPEENKDTVTAITREIPGLRLVEHRVVHPVHDKFDGAYAARLVLTEKLLRRPFSME